MPSHYVHFTADEFAVDPPFRRWCLSNEADSEAFWQVFLHQHPDKAEAVALARQIVLETDRHFGKRKASQQEIEMAYRKTLQTVQRQRPVVQLRSRRQWQVAATVALLVATAAVFGYLTFRQNTGPTLTEYRTDYGQQQTILLPDGSTVQLNADSKLILDEDWDADTRREVWLEGEAYFSVEKKPATQAKFVVHAEQLTVEVLGTQFNVNTKEEATQVTLDEGKIKLSAADDNEATRAVTMVPGEIALFSNVTQEINIQRTNTRQYSSWKDGYLTYEEARLAEVLDDMHHTFGYTIVVQDSLLLNETITGALSARDLDALLLVLEDIMPNISFSQKDKQLIVTARE